MFTAGRPKPSLPVWQANSSRSFAEARYQQTARRLTAKGPNMESDRPAGQLLEWARVRIFEEEAAAFRQKVNGVQFEKVGS
jgi:hypothetical protein